MSPHAARRAVDAFAALIAISIGIALAGLTWRLLGDSGERFGALPVAARRARPVDLQSLIALAPFGNAAAATAPATDQSLVLRGIMLAEPRAASAALISVNGAAPQPFAIGQAIGPGTIADIAIDHVVFATGGGRQSLAFPDHVGAPTTIGGAAPAPVASPAPPMSGPGPVPPMSGAAPTMAPPPGPAALLSGIGAPGADGLHVGQPSATMIAAGLQPGDVVSAINGIAAADAARDPAALSGALATGVARLEVTRAGRHLTLAVPLR